MGRWQQGAHHPNFTCRPASAGSCTQSKDREVTVAAGVVSVGPEDGPSASVREAREALVPLLKTPWEGRPHGPFVRRFSASSK